MARMINLTAESALETVHKLLGTPLNNSQRLEAKVVARDKIKTAIDTLRACAEEHCPFCHQHWIHIDKLLMIHGDMRNRKQYIESCSAQFEQREIARLTGELERVK